MEHYEYIPRNARAFPIFNRVPVPDAQQYGLRDFGNRVGFWRVADALHEFGVTPTVSLNLAVLDHYPEMRDLMIERSWAIMSHGIYNTSPVYGYTVEEERAFLRENVEIVRRYTGKQLNGMLGPTLSATLHTPDLMTEAGLSYTADWPIDDQPVPIRTANGQLVAVPYSFDLNDGNPAFRFDLAAWAEQCRRQFDRLWVEGESSGRVMCVGLHPFIVGQADQIGYLYDVLEHLCSRDGVWLTTADDIAGYWLSHHHVDDDSHGANADEAQYAGGGGRG